MAGRALLSLEAAAALAAIRPMIHWAIAWSESREAKRASVCQIANMRRLIVCVDPGDDDRLLCGQSQVRFLPGVAHCWSTRVGRRSGLCHKTARRVPLATPIPRGHAGRPSYPSGLSTMICDPARLPHRGIAPRARHRGMASR